MGPTHEAITTGSKKPTKKPHATTGRPHKTSTTTKKPEWQWTTEWSWTSSSEPTTEATPEPEPYDHPLSGLYRIIGMVCMWSFFPVSYTHLDVYKRQVSCSILYKYLFI